MICVEVVVITNTADGSYDLSLQSEALIIRGGSAADAITAGSGADVITGGAGADAILGGAGADTITGSEGADSLLGGTGDDTLVAEGTDTLIDGGANTDTVQFGAAVATGDLADTELADVEVVVITNAGHAVYDLSAQTEALTIFGGGGNDTILVGSSLADTISGGAGDDIIAYGSSELFIALANDQVTDTIDGGTGTDTVRIAGGINIQDDDDLARAESIEALAAASGSSTVVHSVIINDNGRLNDVRRIDLSGSSAADATAVVTLTGVTRDMTLVGVAAGASTLTAGSGTDTLSGGTGNDKLFGADGNDTLVAGNGDDTLNGGSGTDSLNGGAGNDIYDFASSAEFIDNVSLNGVLDVFADASGTDTVRIMGAITVDGDDSLSGATNIEVLAAANSASASTHSIIVQNDAALGAIRTFDLSGSENSGSQATITLNSGITIGVTVIGVATGRSIITTEAGVDTVTGGTGNDTIATGEGNDTILAKDGIDILNGGDGNDLYLYETSAQFVNNAELAVVDTINEVAGLGSADVVRVTGGINISVGASLAKAEQVERLEAASQSGAITHAITINTDARLNDFRVIDLSGSSGATAQARVDLTGVTVGVTMVGTGGVDTLVGGGGFDTLTGGAGADRFGYRLDTDLGTSGLFNSTTNRGDTIIDFVSGTDDVRLTGSYLTGSMTGTTANDATSFAFGAGLDLDAAGTGTDTVLVFNGVTDQTSLSALQAAIGTITNETAGDERIFVFNGGSNAVMYKFTAITADNLLSANELQILANFNTTLGTGDFIFS
ncbi:MAG: beta strand repeat-containing protein [Rhodospirillales bacterium]